MFDLTSSKLLILGVVALIVVGPKELPFLLRTIGKYVGMIRRQANEFRAQFDEAMREAELASIKEDLEKVARETENSIRAAETSVARDVHAANAAVDQSIKAPHAATAVEAVHEFDALNGVEVHDGTAAGHAAVAGGDGLVAPAATDAVPEAGQAGQAGPHEFAKTGT